MQTSELYKAKYKNDIFIYQVILNLKKSMKF